MTKKSDPETLLPERLDLAPKAEVKVNFLRLNNVVNFRHMHRTEWSVFSAETNHVEMLLDTETQLVSVKALPEGDQIYIPLYNVASFRTVK